MPPYEKKPTPESVPARRLRDVSASTTATARLGRLFEQFEAGDVACPPIVYILAGLDEAVAFERLCKALAIPANWRREQKLHAIIVEFDERISKPIKRGRPKASTAAYDDLAAAVSNFKKHAKRINSHQNDIGQNRNSKVPETEVAIIEFLQELSREGHFQFPNRKMENLDARDLAERLSKARNARRGRGKNGLLDLE
jgi:hypothetical protein